VSRRLVGLVLLLAALGLHLGLAVPARRQRDVARADFARGRQERERLREQVARLERRTAATARAPSGDAAAVRAVRLSLLRATGGLPVGVLRISVQAGRGTAAARGQLVAEGRQVDLLRVAGKLAEPPSGLLLERVQLGPAGEGRLQLQVDAFSVRAGP
jgi:hypothetical protein